MTPEEVLDMMRPYPESDQFGVGDFLVGVGIVDGAEWGHSVVRCGYLTTKTGDGFFKMSDKPLSVYLGKDHCWHGLWNITQLTRNKLLPGEVVAAIRNLNDHL